MSGYVIDEELFARLETVRGFLGHNGNEAPPARLAFFTPPVAPHALAAAALPLRFSAISHLLFIGVQERSLGYARDDDAGESLIPSH